MDHMKLLITGATGLIGKLLCQRLFEKGHDLWVCTRSPQDVWQNIPVPVTAVQWPLEPSSKEVLQSMDGVINLMGESIASGRWSTIKKQTFYHSRVGSTTELFEALERADAKLKVWVNASAIGVYGAHADNVYDETSPAGNDYLASLVQAWEKTVFNTAYGPNPNLRRVVMRIGIVLSTQGGALQKMLPAFENHLGGSLSNGRQWFSWIHIDDVVNCFVEAVENANMHGAYNAVAPESATNKSFTQTMGRVLKKITPFPVPAPLLKLALGEMSTLLLEGHCVVPKRLQTMNFKFQYSRLEDALKHLLQHHDEGIHRFEALQWLPHSVETIFKFFSNPNNLEDITPELLCFKVKSMSTDTIEKGTLLDYQLKIHGIPKKWKTLIESWDPPHGFVDTQLEGPYQLWHHTHTFTALRGGTLMKDVVLYKIPFGILGRLAEMLFVKRDLESVFSYRRNIIQQRYGHE